MQTKKIHPSNVSNLIVETTVGLTLFSAFGRMFRLPLYVYVAAKGDMPEPIETGITAALVIVSLGFAILATAKPMKSMHKYLLT